MSGATPTIIPRESIFPRLLPKPPQPHPVPLSKRRVYASSNAFRDFQREMDELSDEENELDDLNLHIHNRGYGFLVPIGRSLTRQEEKNDADDDESDGAESNSGHSAGGANSVLEDDGENESTQDLDASMEDLDEDMTADTDDLDEEIAEIEEGSDRSDFP